MNGQKVPTNQLWEHYKISKSVWKTADNFGMCGQSVHERLKNYGYKLYGERFSKEEDEIIKNTYLLAGNKHIDLKSLTKKIGRPQHTNVSRRARELGLTNMNREKPQSVVDLSSRRILLAMKNGALPRSYSNIHKGWYEFSGDKKYYLKSGWEVKYANYLETIKNGNAIKDWEYEPQTFWFEKIKRGVRSYTPDFRVTYRDNDVEFHEVKGWMDDKSKTKIKRMRIYYPKVKLVIIEKVDMKRMGLI